MVWLCNSWKDDHWVNRISLGWRISANMEVYWRQNCSGKRNREPCIGRQDKDKAGLCILWSACTSSSDSTLSSYGCQHSSRGYPKDTRRQLVLKRLNCSGMASWTEAEGWKKIESREEKSWRHYYMTTNVTQQQESKQPKTCYSTYLSLMSTW